MAWVDWLLNLVCLLLILSLWVGRKEALRRPVPALLAGTLRPAGSTRRPVGLAMVVLLLVLLVRTWMAWWAADWASWNPRVDMGLFQVSFPVVAGWRGFGLMGIYGLLSLGVLLVGFWLWMVLVGCLGRGILEMNPVYRMAVQCVGLPLRWPWPVVLGLAVGLVSLAWLLVEPLLAGLGLLPGVSSWPRRGGQAVLVGLGSCLVWKPLLVGLLLLYWLNLYVYLGQHAFWEFVTRAGRRLVAPLRRLPLQVMKIDLAAPLMAAGIWWGAYVAEHGWDLPLTRYRVSGLVEIYGWLGQ